jgi:UDP-glucose 4-epimerase
MKKTIILFGATGTVGVYTAMDLISAGYNVVAVGHRKSDNGFFENEGANYFSVDISRKDDFNKLPKSDIFAVIHFAGSMPARMQIYNPQEYIDSIITGTLNVLDYVKETGVNRIIYAQSISDIAYACGSTNPIDPDIESRFPLNDDHSIYSICKNTAVNLIEHYYYKYGIKRFILRLPNIYLYHPNPYYYVDNIKKWQSYRLIIEKARKGDPIEIWGDPTRLRDIVYVKDLTQIVVNSLKVNVEGGMYNVGTGVGVSFENQIKGIINVFTEDKRSEIIYRPDKPNSPQYIFDISKTKRELNYIPKYDYHNYLLDMKNEMKINRFAKLWQAE